jgi:hypothetical protein
VISAVCLNIVIQNEFAALPGAHFFRPFETMTYSSTIRSLRSIVLLIPGFLFVQASHAQGTFNTWNNFEGKLGNSDIQMSLYLFKNGDLKGNYILKYVSTKILLTGSKKGNVVNLTEQISGQPGRTFGGRILSDTLVGTWTDIAPRPALHFHLRLISSTAGSFEHRYADLFGTTEDVEQFVQTARSAILTNNKDWVTDHTSYPLKHLVGPGFNGIGNKQQLIQYFSQIFTKEYKEKISHAYTTNLFVKNGSVMLGNGELWISNKPGSTKDQFDYTIIAVNP